LRLLLPKYRIAEFEHRNEELSTFDGWCNEAQPIDLRLYVGAGGTGKTRLMIEACESNGFLEVGVRASCDAPITSIALVCITACLKIVDHFSSYSTMPN